MHQFAHYYNQVIWLNIKSTSKLFLNVFLSVSLGSHFPLIIQLSSSCYLFDKRTHSKYKPILLNCFFNSAFLKMNEVY